MKIAMSVLGMAAALLVTGSMALAHGHAAGGRPAAGPWSCSGYSCK